MNILIVITALFLSQLALATDWEPKVGNSTLNRTFMSFDGGYTYSPFDMKSTVYISRIEGDEIMVQSGFANSSLTTGRWVSREDIKKWTITNLDQYCTQVSGKIETISVPAGTFRTCRELVRRDHKPSYTVWRAAGLPLSSTVAYQDTMWREELESHFFLDSESKTADFVATETTALEFNGKWKGIGSIYNLSYPEYACGSGELQLESTASTFRWKIATWACDWTYIMREKINATIEGDQLIQNGKVVGVRKGNRIVIGDQAMGKTKSWSVLELKGDTLYVESYEHGSFYPFPATFKFRLKKQTH